MYDYYLGGVNHFPADREAAEHVLRAAPWIRATALENRAFLGRAVRFLAAEGSIGQFIDIGTGLPAKGSVHDVVSRVAPGARVAYVDNDPVVLGQSRAILSGVDGVASIRADLRQPATIIGHPDLAGFVDWSEPVAVLLVAVVHFIEDLDDPLAIIGQFRDVMAPGSYLVITHIHHHAISEAAREVTEVYTKASAPLVFRTRDQITRLFAGFELVAPGIVSIPEWRPEPRPYPPGDVWGLAGIGCLGTRPGRP
jgi:SAM-dependent methyltransferase